MASYTGRMQDGSSSLIPACRSSRDPEMDRSHTCVGGSDPPVPEDTQCPTEALLHSQPCSTPCPDGCQAMVSILISPAFPPQATAEV